MPVQFPDSNNPQRTSGQQPQQGGRNGVDLDQPRAKVWMNVGRRNPDNPEILNSGFSGIAIDTAPKPRINTEENNHLYNTIQAIAAELEPGERVTLDLEVQLFRVREDFETPVEKVADLKASLLATEMQKRAKTESE